MKIFPQIHVLLASFTRAVAAALTSILLVAGTGLHVSAQDVAPDALVKSVANDVISIIKSDKEIQSGNQRRMVELAEVKILPHFNFARMTALAMGPNWRKATPDQQKLLTEQFRTLLVHTYSSGLGAYRNQTIEYKPLRAKPGDTEVLVRSEIKQSGAQPIAIDYNMEKIDSAWKVFDVAIGGVSLVTTYRETFNQEVRANGVDGLIKTLVDKNKQLDERK